MGQVYRTLSRE